MLSPIHHTFAPLADREQRKLASRLLFMPWLWKKGAAQGQLKDELRHRFQGNVYLFASGREALLALLQSIKLRPKEEVIVQAYTCVVVPNAILAADMVPVYCDIERETLNMDIDALERAITPLTRVIICQHTFGIPARLDRLREICDQRSIFLIEDCAHYMPDERSHDGVGQYGDYAVFSFGRDKAVSGVTGGAVVCRSPNTAFELQKKEEQARDLSLFGIKRLLLYPFIYTFAKSIYGIGIGKAFLYVCGKIGILPPILTAKEKKGKMTTTLHKLPNACAALALDQIKRLDQLNDHRRQLTRYYVEEGNSRQWPMLAGVTDNMALQKFPLFVQGAEGIRNRLKRHNIHLHDGWTGCVVCPDTVDMDETKYLQGLDPAAEAACKEILSLPTHPTMRMEQAERLVELFDAELRKRQSIGTAKPNRKW